MITIEKVDDGSDIAFSAVSKEADGRQVLGLVRIVRSWFEAEIEERCVGRAFDVANAKDLLVSQLQYRAVESAISDEPADASHFSVPAHAPEPAATPIGVRVEAPGMAPADLDEMADGAGVFSQDKTALWPPASAMLRAQSRAARERPAIRSRPVRPERRVGSASSLSA